MIEFFDLLWDVMEIEKERLMLICFWFEWRMEFLFIDTEKFVGRGFVGCGKVGKDVVGKILVWVYLIWDVY